MHNSLYKIRPQLEALAQQLDAMLGDAPDDEQLRHDTADETDALDALRRIVREALALERDAKALAAYRNQLLFRQSRMEKQAEACRSTVKECLGILGMKRLLAPDFSASVSPGRPAVVVPDPAKLPAQYQRVTIEPRKLDIKRALEAGEPVEGACFGNAEPVLTVRQS